MCVMCPVPPRVHAASQTRAALCRPRTAPSASQRVTAPGPPHVTAALLSAPVLAPCRTRLAATMVCVLCV